MRSFFSKSEAEPDASGGGAKLEEPEGRRTRMARSMLRALNKAKEKVKRKKGDSDSDYSDEEFSDEEAHFRR